MDAMQTVDSYFRELESRHDYSGVVLITRGTEQLFAGAYGYASRAWQVPNKLETRFDTASMTKMFTAVATLQLVDRGAFEIGRDPSDTDALSNAARALGL